ncbi:MAG: hypothetical protein V5A84_00335 [Planctomycetota bacterium]
MISDYNIPLLPTDMKYFDPRGARDLFNDLRSKGYRFKYIILDGEEKGRWYKKYALENDWRCIYRSAERNIRIYMNPHNGERAEGSE